MTEMKYLFAGLIIITSLSVLSCANNDDTTAPAIVYHEATPTITIEQLYAKADATLQKYSEEDILEAYVTSSDEGGTFYKSVSLQNLEGSRGFSIAVDMYNINNDFEPGRKVYIYLKDLYFNIAHGSLILGDIYQDTSVGRMRPQDFYRTVFASKDILKESDLVKKRTLAELKNNQYINTLIDIENVQFDDSAIGKTFYDPGNAFSGATHHKIIDKTSKMIFRTSEFAEFATKKVPPESGKIRGVLTKYNSDFQFMARTFRDIQLTNIRIRETTSIGGDQMKFETTIDETFESFPVSDNNQTHFPQYGNDYTTGGRYWAVKSFQNNKYIQVNAFGNSSAETKSYFIIPVKFSGSNTFSFETKDGYYNGNVLSVYYVDADSYIYGSLVNTTNFTNITDKFTYSTGTANGYAASFVSSGSYQFPASILGNGYIIFEYSGTTTVSTTIQIDNIHFH